MWGLLVFAGTIGRATGLVVLSMDLELLVLPALKANRKKEFELENDQVLTSSVVGSGSSGSSSNEETFPAAIGAEFCCL